MGNSVSSPSSSSSSTSTSKSSSSTPIQSPKPLTPTPTPIPLSTPIPISTPTFPTPTPTLLPTPTPLTLPIPRPKPLTPVHTRISTLCCNFASCDSSPSSWNSFTNKDKEEEEGSNSSSDSDSEGPGGSPTPSPGDSDIERSYNVWNIDCEVSNNAKGFEAEYINEARRRRGYRVNIMAIVAKYAHNIDGLVPNHSLSHVSIIGNQEEEEKIRRFAKLNENEKFVEEFNCINRQYGIPGRLILTINHLVFFDSIPESKIKKEGKLWRLGYLGFVIEKLNPCLLVLKADKLSYHKDVTNLYTPSELIPLHQITSVALKPEKKKQNRIAFEIVMDKQSQIYFTETEDEAKSWVDAISGMVQKRKEKVGTKDVLSSSCFDDRPMLIVIPLASITSIEKTKWPVLQTEAISIATDFKLYQFTHFYDAQAALFQIQEYQLYHSTDEHNKEEKALIGIENVSEPTKPSEDIITQFHDIFNLPESEILIADCKCAMWSSYTPYQGRLYISTRHVAFYSNLLGIVTMALIPYQDILNSSLYHQKTSLKIETKAPTNFANAKEFNFTGWSLANVYSILINQFNFINFPKERTFDTVELLESELAALEKRKIVMLIVGSRGDVQPFIAFAKELQSRGHEVAIATHEAHKKFVEDWEIEYRHLAGDPKDLMALCSNNEMFSVKFFKEALQNFTSFIEQLLDTAWEACQGCDTIIQNPPSMAGPHIAEKLNVPLFCAFTMPWSRTHAMPHPFVTPEEGSFLVGARFNYASYVAVEQGIWQPLRPIVNAFRAKKLNLPQISFGAKGHSLLHNQNIPFFYCWSPSIIPKPADWGDHIHVTGYWFLDAPISWKPSQDLLDFLEQDPKPIYIGFGSIVIDDPDKLTQIVIDSLRESNVRAILNKGWGGMSGVEFPSFIYEIDSVPHDWLFPRVAAVVHHGGAGTTAAGLRAGVPTLIIPFFGDQFFWSNRVSNMGVGVQGIPFKSLTTENLTQALKQLTSNPELGIAAQNIGETIRKERGCENAASLLAIELRKWHLRHKKLFKEGRS